MQLLRLIMAVSAGMALFVQSATAQSGSITVNGVELAAWEVERELAGKVAYGSFHRQITPDQRSEMRHEAIQSLVLKELKQQWAQSADISAEADTVEAAWAKVRGRFADEKAYESALEQQGATHESFYAAFVRDQLARQVDQQIRESVKHPSDEEVTAFFKLHQEDYVRPEARRFTHMLFSVSPEAKRAVWQETEERARALAERAEQDPSVLATEIERSRGDLPPRYQDQVGDTGFLHRGSLRPELEEALFAAERGAIVGPVRTIYGFHVVQVVDIKEPEPIELDSVREAVFSRMFEDRRTEHLNTFEEGLRSAATIEGTEWHD